MPVSHARDPDGDRPAGWAVISCLLEVFGALADPRSPRGIRHELASVLTVTVLAALTGARNFREIGDRASELPQDLLAAAGARVDPRSGQRQAPSSATIRRLVHDMDAEHADALVGAWLASCVAAARAARSCSEALPAGLDGLALDGKTVRHSATPDGVPDVRLFSALLHDEQVVISQIAVPENTTEVTCVPKLLDRVDLTDKVITADAAHTQRTTATYLAGTREADYCLQVKGNQPHLLCQITKRIPNARTEPAHHRDEQITGGQRIVREIWVVDTAGIDFPHAAQVFRIRRQTYDLSGNRLSKEIVHGITSLTTGRATPRQVLGLVRRHWRVETNHQIRDVTWREDHQHAYTGTGAQVMAMIRNLALAILRLTGQREITRTVQRIAADRTLILPILARFPLPVPT